MDRLISEFEVIRAIERYVDNIFTKNMGDLINDIKAIPTAEPCEDNEIMKRLSELPNVTLSDGQEYIQLYDAMETVKRVLEQEPKTGHWSRKTKVDAYDIAGVKTWGIKCQCDRCDFTTIVVEDFGYYKYCPNCGAKMIEPQERSE